MSEDQTTLLTAHGSLARRLLTAALVSAAVMLVFAVMLLTLLFSRTVFSEIDDRLSAVTESLLADVQITDQGDVALARRPTDPSYTRSLSGRYWQVGFLSEEARLTSGSMAGERLQLDALAERALADPGGRVIGQTEGPDGEVVRVHVQVLTLGDDPRRIVFAAAEDRAPAEREVLGFVGAAALIFVVFSLIMAVSIRFLVRYGLEPVDRMGRAVAAVRDGEQRRISGHYPRELLPLAEELNALLDHSRGVVERARTHVGNLAHALKTPLTVLSNEARGEQGALSDMVERQTQLMSDQVAHHLRRARAAANAQAIGARTPVDEVLDDLGRTLSKIYAREGKELSWTCPADLSFRGERQDLEDLAGNLMDNACKWAAGRVRAFAEPVEPGGWRLVIDDDGPGLSADQRAQVLERGVRLDEQAPGAGLGLAIVNDLARAYGGALELGASPMGGLRAELSLPGGVRREASGETRR